MLLIIPGIIWSIKFRFCSYLVIDKGLGPIDALRISSKITKGVKQDLVVFDFLRMGIVILGFLALFVGLFVAIPVTWIADAYVYKKLVTQIEENTSNKQVL